MTKFPEQVDSNFLCVTIYLTVAVSVKQSPKVFKFPRMPERDRQRGKYWPYQIRATRYELLWSCLV